MALTPCPECGHSVSDTAAACPSCGHTIAGTGTKTGSATNTRMERNKWWFGPVLLVAVLIVVFSTFTIL